jgi:hypothetical protein
MPRFGHTATLLPDGRVLVAGGDIPDQGGTISDPLLQEPVTRAYVAGPSAELYDPLLRVWRPAGDMIAPRARHSATLLRDGDVLVAGGTNPRTGEQEATAELYLPERNAWVRASGMAQARSLHTATLMRDGTLLVVGGYRLGAGFLASAERYNPTADRWTAAASLTPALSVDAATLLRDGRALVVGSEHSDGEQSTLAEVFRD